MELSGDIQISKDIYATYQNETEKISKTLLNLYVNTLEYQKKIEGEFELLKIEFGNLLAQMQPSEISALSRQEKSKLRENIRLLKDEIEKNKKCLKNFLKIKRGNLMSY
ncbi:hypothetical protein IM40_01265 [Candidatus Paracaedimonas acanthamoebae]|nr:hypothetical protein IM40_01265 [Candidatus Paracaedimonas acanthamoebae]